MSAVRSIVSKSIKEVNLCRWKEPFPDNLPKKTARKTASLDEEQLFFHFTWIRLGGIYYLLF